MYKQRRTLRCGGRPRAFWGAIIGAATSIAGSLLGNAAEKKKQKLANSKEDYNQSLQEAQSMSNALNQSMDYQNNYYDQYRVAARYGRRTLADNGHKIVITDGGDAKRIGNDTFLLRGGSHEDVNETGQTGIGINVGGNEIEAEGGEVAQKKGNSLRIFSAQPMLGGISPAEAVIQGANKDKVFKAQQKFKKNNHLKDDGTKATWGTNDWIEGAKTIGSYLPIIGTIEDGYNFYKNPTLENAGWAGLGLVSDLFGGRAIVKGIKTLRTIRKAAKASKNIVNRSDRAAFQKLLKENYDHVTKQIIKASQSVEDQVLQDRFGSKQKYGGNNMIKQKYSLGGDIRSFWNFLKTNRSPIANIAAIGTAYQKLNPNSDYNKMKGKYSGGKNFRGAGANITWTDDYKPKKGFDNFNDAYDDAVDHNAETFIFGGKRYNTLRENNPLREINNRAVGIWRDSIVTKDRNGYGKDFGPLKGPATAVPMITETYVPKRRKHLLGGRPKAEDGILKYFNDVQETDAVPTRLFNERRRLTYNNPDYDAGPGTIVDNVQEYINEKLPHSNNPYLEEAGFGGRGVSKGGKGKLRGTSNRIARPKLTGKGKIANLTISTPTNTNLGLRNIPTPTRNINVNPANIRYSNTADFNINGVSNTTRHLATTNRKTIANPTGSKGEYKFDFRLPKQYNFDAINWRYRQPTRVPYTKALPGKVQQPRTPGGIAENDAASNAARKAAEASNDVLQSLQKVYRLKHPFARSTPKETYNPNRFNREYRRAAANGQTREEFIRGKRKDAGKAGKYAAMAAAGPVSAAIISSIIGKDDVNGGNKNNINTQLSPYIARPFEQLNKTSQKKPAVKQKANSLPEVVATAKKPANKQYKGNVTKGNYQLHDGESKVINGIKYTRSGNIIINHKNNVGYVYDNNGNYTGQADYSKVGKNFNDAFDAARAAGRSNFIYRAGKYNKYSTVKEEDKNKEALNRKVGARRVAKRLGGYTHPVERLRCGGSARPKANDGGLYSLGYNNRYGNTVRTPYEYALSYSNTPNPSNYVVPTRSNNIGNTSKIDSKTIPNGNVNSGNYRNTTFTTGDYIGLGIDTAAALATGIINYRGAGNYSLPERAGFIQAGKLKTNYNVNPQVAELERARDRMSQDVYRNTSSSVAALNRANILNVNAAQDINKLLAEKENKETELINQDILNRQSVSEKNVANQMAYNNSVAEIKNAANQSRINALNTSLSGLSQAWTNFYTAGRSAFEDNQARIAAIAASEKGSLSRMLLSGYRLDDDTLSNLYRNEENADTKRLILNSMSPRARRRLGII